MKFVQIYKQKPLFIKNILFHYKNTFFNFLVFESKELRLIIIQQRAPFVKVFQKYFHVLWLSFGFFKNHQKDKKKPL